MMLSELRAAFEAWQRRTFSDEQIAEQRSASEAQEAEVNVKLAALRSQAKGQGHD